MYMGSETELRGQASKNKTDIGENYITSPGI